MSSVSYISSSITTASATSTSTSSTDNSESDTLTFLSLLTTQLENQNPLDPVDTTEFTSQLVQYSSLEQLINMSSKLDDVVSGLTSANMMSSLSYLGADAQIDSAESVLQDSEVEWNYVVGDDASTVALSVADEDGNVVFSQIVDNVTAGTYDLTTSSSDLGTSLESGKSYTLSVTAQDENGDDITTSVSSIVTIDNISSDSTSVTAYAGAISFSMDDILAISKSAA